MVFIAVYFFLILVFILGLIRLPLTKIDPTLPQQKFSIIIPFRNEEQNIEALLKSIQNLRYHSENFEILLIDDHSTDGSTNKIKEWLVKLPNLKILNNCRVTNAPKKDAIQVGLKHALFDFIITTDADCILPKNWLHSYNTVLKKEKSLFVAGPISLNTEDNFVQQYQKYDNLSLIGATMGSFGIKRPMMCNASNMGFDKKKYLEMSENHKSIASGDDIFTLEYFTKNYPKKVHFLNSDGAMVKTKAERTWKNTLQQRIRWAAKTPYYKSVLTKVVGLIVLSTQLAILLNLLHQPSHSLVLWIIKMAIDFLLILIVAKKTNQTTSYLQYLRVAIIYPLLNSYIGIKSLFGGYTWKGREFRR
jgi:poly-beta-1,6-N-acetyl-D-glucosamine synthase